jgi:glycosyltransferase involved in cell wall biosynthesis
MRQGVCLIIPVRDEADGLSWLLPQLVNQYRTIVVDNDSSDGSAAVARAAGAEVLLCSERGFGDLIKAALTHLGKASRRQNLPQLVVISDVEGFFQTSSLERFIEPIKAGRTQLVFSHMEWRGKEKMPLPRALGQGIVRLLLKLVIGVDPGPYGTLVACDYEVLRSMELEERSWAWLVELRIKAKILSLVCLAEHVPCPTRPTELPKGRTHIISGCLYALRLVWAIPYYTHRSRKLLRTFHWGTQSLPP